MSRMEKGERALGSVTLPGERDANPLVNRQGYRHQPAEGEGGDRRSPATTAVAVDRTQTGRAGGRLTQGWRDGSVSLESAIMAQGRARYGRPTRILLSVGPTAEREKMLAAFEYLPNFEVKTVKGLDFTSIEDAYRTDYLIVWFEGLQKLRETDANAFVKLSRRARVIVALSSDRLLEAASTLHLADAWLFTDMVLDQIAMLVGLSDSGYTIVPARVGNDFGLDNLRCQLMHKLDDGERLVLEQLGVGNSNREISLRLDISEPQTKAIVRNILSKLHFRNRTEAAVFMARRHGMLVLQPCATPC
jgi:two-component system nitrate/nitrite response regulator NarL